MTTEAKTEPDRDEACDRYIYRVRVQSSYKVLRVLIDTTLTIGAIIVIPIATWTMLNILSASKAAEYVPFLPVAWTVVGPCILIGVTIAVRQSSVLFIDMADILIDANRNKHKPNKAPEPTTTSVTSPAAQEPRQP